jgi:non-ribosomal peptide synthetase component F
LNFFGVTHYDCTPTGLSTITEFTSGGSSSASPFPSLKVIAVGGEAPSEALITYWRPRVSLLLNTFGPTEAAVDFTSLIIDGSHGATVIGRPHRTARVYVLNSRSL